MTSTPSLPAARGRTTLALVGWALYDFANSAYSAVIQTFIFAAYFAQAVVGNDEQGQAYWGYTVGAAGLCVALAGPVLGATADQGGRRKPWIVGFSAVCIAATAAMWFVMPTREALPLAVVLAVVSTIASEAAVIFYNAMLPALAPPGKIGRWSGIGWAFGYGATVPVMLLALFVFINPDPSPFGLDRAAQEHVRATFLLVAAWFAVFMLPFIVLTPDAPGTGKPLGRAVRDGFAQIATSLRHARGYGDVVRFLVAKMFYIDGLTTVFTIGGVYAATTFNLDTQGLILFGIALNATGAVGAAALSVVDDWIGGRNLVLASLAAVIVCGSAILLVTSVAWFWVFALGLGVFVGPLQAASRSYLARVAPPGLVNEFFGLYALSGKATAFLGPTLVGVVTAATGSTRVGMSVAIAFFAIGFAIMLTVPSVKDVKDGGATTPAA